jgi:hypothetical protein
MVWSLAALALWGLLFAGAIRYEVTQAMTQYVGGPNGIDLRHQVSAMYKF